MLKNWENVLVSPSQTIHEALKIIDKEASRIVLVVAKDRKLLGTITDGDVRRGLLNNSSMEESVESIMNNNPVTLENGLSIDSMKDVMVKKGILSLPIVENGIVVGITSINESTEKLSIENPVFIMAGGFGTRLRPLTNECPKPLLKVGDKPILEITLQNFISYGFKNFYISTHFMPEKIMSYFGNGEKWGVTITYVHEEVPLGTGGALGLLPAEINKLPLIMINGDVLTNINYTKLLNFHNQDNAEATMCVREYEYQIPYGVVTGNGNKVTGMVEKPVQHFYVNAGIYVINHSVIDSVHKNMKIDMPTLLENVMAKDGNVLMFPIHEYWLDIGRMDDFEKAQRDIYNIGFNI
ncbi:nucleotidyltransferase family protein [Erwinia pyri]|uniref:Nucleotidyltransferase family protein n=1 Tax=Erwinia pyri TaxID=3062598 RepID=A0AA50DM26_9GAMM|nr:nucleotidyltransferase family protein [Erwinia sp. DE2]WLS80305.1 nucleotidyltransferase family protein [Erwinia sp. DE2]